MLFDICLLIGQVVGVSPENNPRFLKVLRDYNVITYSIELTCKDGDGHSNTCTFSADKTISTGITASVNMMRYYIYQWFARAYNPGAQIIISDFRDVFFQSNPFAYKTKEWAPPVAQFVAFQEPVR